MTETSGTKNAEREANDAIKKVKRKKMIILLGASVLAMAAGLIGSTYASTGNLSFFSGSEYDSANTGSASEAGAPAEDPVAAEVETALLPMEEMYVNIKGFTAAGNMTDRVMRIRLSVVYNASYDTEEENNEGEAGAAKGMAAKEPYLRDMFLGYLRQITDRDLAGSTGLAEVKKELVKRARAVTGGDDVRDILISDLIVQ